MDDIVLGLGLFGLIGWGLWLLYRRHELHLRLKLERTAALGRMIEKSGSSQEVIAFLESEAGARLFAEHTSARSQRTLVVRFVLGGIILAMLGAAFLVSARMTAAGLGATPDINDIRELMEKREWAVFMLSLAASFWIVALVYRFLNRDRAA